jgi:xanthine dehydrogenase small subunit
VTAVEEFLRGKVHSLETFQEAGRVAREAVEPISDVRGSRDYRLQLAENVMVKFWYETAGEKELACL